jgi:hypothetical protein
MGYRINSCIKVKSDFVMGMGIYVFQSKTLIGQQ